MKSFAACALFAAATAAHELSFETALTIVAPEATHDATALGATEDVTSNFTVTVEESLTGTGEVGEEWIEYNTVVNYSHKTTISASVSESFDDVNWNWTLCSYDGDVEELVCVEPVMIRFETDPEEFVLSSYNLPVDYFTNGGNNPFNEASSVGDYYSLTSSTSAGSDIQQVDNIIVDAWVDTSAWSEWSLVYTVEKTLGDSTGTVTEFTYGDIGSWVSSPCELLLEGEAPESDLYTVSVSIFYDRTNDASDFQASDITNEVFALYHEVCSGATSLVVSAATVAIALMAM